MDLKFFLHMTMVMFYLFLHVAVLLMIPLGLVGLVLGWGER